MKTALLCAAFIFISACPASLSSKTSLDTGTAATVLFTVWSITRYFGVPTNDLIQLNRKETENLKKMKPNLHRTTHALEKDFQIKGCSGGDCQFERHPHLEREWSDADHAVKEVQIFRNSLKKNLEKMESDIDSMAKDSEAFSSRKQHLELRVRLESTADGLNRINKEINEFKVMLEKCRKNVDDLKLKVRLKKYEEKSWRNVGAGTAVTGVACMAGSFFIPAVGPLIGISVCGPATAWGAWTFWNYSEMMSELDKLIKCIDNSREKLKRLQKDFKTFRDTRKNLQDKVNMLMENQNIQFNEFANANL